MTTIDQPSTHQAGDLVTYPGPYGTELALVDEPGDTRARIITPSGQDWETSTDTLTPLPLPDDTRQLLTDHLRRLHEARSVLDAQLEAERADHHDTRRRHHLALGTIADIRRYAIKAHRSGDICRRGLDDFLIEHNLDPYQPRFSATVTITADVEIDAHDIETAEDFLTNDLTYDITIPGGDNDMLTIRDTRRDIDHLDDIAD